MEEEKVVFFRAKDSLGVSDLSGFEEVKQKELLQELMAEERVLDREKMKKEKIKHLRTCKNPTKHCCLCIHDISDPSEHQKTRFHGYQLELLLENTEKRVYSENEEENELYKDSLRNDINTLNSATSFCVPLQRKKVQKRKKQDSPSVPHKKTKKTIVLPSDRTSAKAKTTCFGGRLLNPELQLLYGKTHEETLCGDTVKADIIISVTRNFCSGNFTALKSYSLPPKDTEGPTCKWPDFGEDIIVPDSPNLFSDKFLRKAEHPGYFLLAMRRLVHMEMTETGVKVQIEMLEEDLEKEDKRKLPFWRDNVSLFQSFELRYDQFDLDILDNSSVKPNPFLSALWLTSDDAKYFRLSFDGELFGKEQYSRYFLCVNTVTKSFSELHSHLRTVKQSLYYPYGMRVSIFYRVLTSETAEFSPLKDHEEFYLKEYEAMLEEHLQKFEEASKLKKEKMKKTALTKFNKIVEEQQFTPTKWLCFWNMWERYRILNPSNSFRDGDVINELHEMMDDEIEEETLELVKKQKKYSPFFSI